MWLLIYCIEKAEQVVSFLQQCQSKPSKTGLYRRIKIFTTFLIGRKCSVMNRLHC